MSLCLPAAVGHIGRGAVGHGNSSPSAVPTAAEAWRRV
jgi:hypothetical protein